MLKPSITYYSSFKVFFFIASFGETFQLRKWSREVWMQQCYTTHLQPKPHRRLCPESLCVSIKRSPHIHLQSDVIWNTSGMSWSLKCHGNRCSAAARLLPRLRVAQHLAVPHSTLWVKVMEEVPQVESRHLQPPLKDPETTENRKHFTHQIMFV